MVFLNVSPTNVSFARKRGTIERNMFRQQRYRNNVSSFAGAFTLKAGKLLSYPDTLPCVFHKVESSKHYVK